jgi:hypothetical protein
MPRHILFASVLALVGCNPPTASNPYPANLAGNWSGSISSTSASGTLNLALTQQNLPETPVGGEQPGYQVVLQGTWSTSFANTVNDANGTVLGGGWDASAPVALWLSESSTCQLVLAGPPTANPTISGTYKTSGCTVADSGTFALTKQ